MVNKHATIIGAGVAGLTCACALLDRGIKVTIHERASAVGEGSCSWFAGGMLAPWCERESAEQAVVDLGMMAADWWQAHTTQVKRQGSLVLSPKRDLRELKRFARLTDNYQWLDRESIAQLEPDLIGFEQGLFFAEEAHLDPRQAILDLAKYIQSKDGEIIFNSDVTTDQLTADNTEFFVIDCRGLSAKDELPDLRGVKGEMLILQSNEISLRRPVRLLHPRYPMYLVPRDNGQFMLGATMIENQQRGRISARSMLELLSAAYALRPEFGEAEVVEIGVDARPAFKDNLPQVHRRKNKIYINGLFRHGFLLSPALACQVADAIAEPKLMELLPLCA